MNIAKRIIELYDRIKFLEGELAYSCERIEELNEEDERLEEVIRQLTAELKAEKVVHKVNEQALVSCEKQLGMTEKAPVVPSESVKGEHPSKCTRLKYCRTGTLNPFDCNQCESFDKFLPNNGCNSCRHVYKEGGCESIVGECKRFNKWEEKQCVANSV